MILNCVSTLIVDNESHEENKNPGAEIPVFVEESVYGWAHEKASKTRPVLDGIF